MINKEYAALGILKLSTAYIMHSENALDLFVFIEYNYHKWIRSSEICVITKISGETYRLSESKKNVEAYENLAYAE